MPGTIRAKDRSPNPLPPADAGVAHLQPAFRHISTNTRQNGHKFPLTSSVTSFTLRVNCRPSQIQERFCPIQVKRAPRLASATSSARGWSSGTVKLSFIIFTAGERPAQRLFLIHWRSMHPRTVLHQGRCAPPLVENMPCVGNQAVGKIDGRIRQISASPPDPQNSAAVGADDAPGNPRRWVSSTCSRDPAKSPGQQRCPRRAGDCREIQSPCFCPGTVWPRVLLAHSREYQRHRQRSASSIAANDCISVIVKLYEQAVAKASEAGLRPASGRESEPALTVPVRRPSPPDR